MVYRYTAVAILTGLLAACGAQREAETPQPGRNLIDLVAIPSGWTTETIAELDPSDIPADAHTGLQESFRAVISEPDQPENSAASSYFLVLLYEDTEAARSAYDQIKTYMIAEGAELGTSGSDLPDEEITFALTNHDATTDRPASTFQQSTILSCRAVLRYNWAVYYGSTSSFTLDEAVNAEMTSIRAIRRATCD